MNCTQTENQQQLQINLISPIFEDLVTSAIDQTLSKLGTNVKQVFYSFLENHYTLRRKEIPDRINEFDDALGKTFGTSATIVEIDIVRNLRQIVPSFTYITTSGELNFEDYVKSLKRHIENF
jgi:hypothetical protein